MISNLIKTMSVVMLTLILSSGCGLDTTNQKQIQTDINSSNLDTLQGTYKAKSFNITINNKGKKEVTKSDNISAYQDFQMKLLLKVENNKISGERLAQYESSFVSGNIGDLIEKIYYKPIDIPIYSDKINKIVFPFNSTSYNDNSNSTTPTVTITVSPEKNIIIVKEYTEYKSLNSSEEIVIKFEKESINTKPLPDKIWEKSDILLEEASNSNMGMTNLGYGLIGHYQIIKYETFKKDSSNNWISVGVEDSIGKNPGVVAVSLDMSNPKNIATNVNYKFKVRADSNKLNIDDRVYKFTINDTQKFDNIVIPISNIAELANAKAIKSFFNNLGAVDLNEVSKDTITLTLYNSSDKSDITNPIVNNLGLPSGVKLQLTLKKMNDRTSLYKEEPKMN